MGIFTEFLFFSHKATDTLCEKLGLSKDTCDTQSIYQFEARYFQYSVLGKRIRFCKDNRKGKEYMIFKFGRISQVTDTALYAICEENNRSQQQPWMCQHIFTLKEMVKFFGLHEQALNVQQGFLDGMRIKTNCVSRVFNVDCECRPRTEKIGNMLESNYQQYLKDLAVRNGGSIVNFNNSNNNINSDSDDLVSTRSNSSNYSGTRSVSLDSDSNSVCSSRSMKSARSNGGYSGKKHGYGNKNEFKIKNEDKFTFLEKICREMGLGLGLGFQHTFGYSFHRLPRELIVILRESIEDAIKFARKYPNTVLTQAYINEENGKISYELVLLGEICNKSMDKYYKFAVPIVECTNNNTGDKYYKAENILTPKMVIDNVRLNSENATFKQDTWIADINDITTSFYEKIDSTWYSNSDNKDDDGCDSDSDSSDDSDDCKSDSSRTLSSGIITSPPSCTLRTVSIEVDAESDELPQYKTQTLSRKSTSNEMFAFGTSIRNTKNRINNNSNKNNNTNQNNGSNNNNNNIKMNGNSEYSTENFYEIGFNINNGGSNKGSKRNNRGRNSRRNFRNYNSNNNNNNNNNNKNGNYQNSNHYNGQNRRNNMNHKPQPNPNFFFNHQANGNSIYY